MKYPLPSIMTVLAMFFPISIAIIFLPNSISINRTIYEIIVIGVIFHSVAVVMWWLYSGVFRDILLQRKNKKLEHFNEIEFNIKKESWIISIFSGSFISFILSLIALGVCLFFGLTFKVFIITIYVLPILRLSILFLEYIYLKNTNKI